MLVGWDGDDDHSRDGDGDDDHHHHGSYDDDVDRRDHHDDGADGTDHDSHLGLLRDCKEHSHRRRCVRTSQTDDGYHDNDLDLSLIHI